MRLAFLALGAGLIAACQKPAASAAPSAATAVVDSLFTARQPFQGNGAPTPGDLATMRPWLGAELATLLQQADSVRSAEALARPDEKPAFADGDLFTSLFEGPTTFDVSEVSMSADSVYRIPVHFTSQDSTTTQRWIDTVLVRGEGGRLVVSDIHYGGTWDFANRGALVASLHAALAGNHP